MSPTYDLNQLHDLTDKIKSQTSRMTDKQLSRALTLNDKLGLHLHFEALLRIREAQRLGENAYPFPVSYRN